MATIEKLTKDGKTIWAATSTTAIIDPDTRETLSDLLNVLLPVTTSYTLDNEVIEVGKPSTITFTLSSEYMGRDITEGCAYSLDGVEADGNTFTETLTPESIGEIELMPTVSYNGKEYQARIIVTASLPSYYGAINTEPTADVIKGLSKMLHKGKEATITNVAYSASHFTYAYPEAFGELQSVKDVNGFEYIGEFEKHSVTIDGIPYNVYTMKDLCTISQGGYSYTFN